MLETIIAITILLITPGPTNTLLFTASAKGGAQKALRLLPFELTAYLMVTVPLVFLGQQLMDYQPILKAVAAAWIVYLAVSLWRSSYSVDATVTPRLIFITTLLNPKGLIFGLVLIPALSQPLGFVLFALLVVGVAALWIFCGTMFKRIGTMVSKAAALWMVFLAAAMVASI